MSAKDPPLLIEVANLSKRYRDKVALTHAHFAVGAGELLGVVGPNGAGKTTLLSILAGVQAQSSGTVKLVGKRVGWAPQQASLCSKLTVTENLQLFARLQRIRDYDATVDFMLRQLHLAHHAHHRVHTLSGGNRQRLNIGLGLLGDPSVIALDEPTMALDPAQRRRLWDFIHALAHAGKAVIFSTHLVQEAFHHAHKVLVLQGGEQIFYGPPMQLLEAAQQLPPPTKTVPQLTQPPGEPPPSPSKGRQEAGPPRRRVVEGDGFDADQLEEAFVAFLTAHTRAAQRE